jgi:hypothetical protein
MKTGTLLIILILAMSFGLSQRNSFADTMTPPNPTVPITLNGTSIAVKYDIEGGKMLSITPDVTSNSITVLIQSNGDGKMTLKLPRSIIDAKQDGGDTHFIIKVNDHGVNYDEVVSLRSRTLTVPFHLGDEKITIKGTQMSLQSEDSSMSNKNLPILVAPFTANPPTIDGKWTTQNEWDYSKAISFEKNGTKVYLVLEHDSDFIYAMGDVVSDQITASNATLVDSTLMMIFDTDNYTGDTFGTKEIGVGTSKIFYHGNKISGGFGSEVWTYDDAGRSQNLLLPLGYNSSMGVSGINDPFDPVHNHRVYEFKIPISFLHKAQKYGFSLKAQTCFGSDVNLCIPVYTVFWPVDTTMSVPSTHGILVLDNQTSTTFAANSSDSSNLQILLAIIGVVISGIVIYFVKIKNKKS